MTIVASNSITVSNVNDGVGIKTTDITYANSTSGTTAPSTGWTSSVPTLVKGQYLWMKTVWTYTDTSSKTAYSVSYNSKDGTNGTDGTSGIIVSSAAPTSPKTGQLWQDTSTTPQLVKKWTGTSWVIWELYAQNLKADSLSAISADLGDVNAGTYTSWKVSNGPVYNYLNGVYIANGRVRSLTIENPSSTNPDDAGVATNKYVRGMQSFADATEYYMATVQTTQTANQLLKSSGGMDFWSQLNDTGGYCGQITAENVSLVPWTNLTYLSGFTTSDRIPCQYRKIKNLDGSYRVEFKGRVKPVSGKFSTTGTNSVISLPITIIPPTDSPAICVGDMSGVQTIRVFAFTDGRIQTAVRGAETSFIDISSLSYTI